MRTWMEELAVCAGPDLVDDGGLRQTDDSRLRHKSMAALAAVEPVSNGKRGEAAGGRGQGRTEEHLQIQEDAARHVLSGTGLGEEGVERIITATDGLVGRHLSIGLDAVLQAIQLPARIADLRNSRSDHDRHAAICGLSRPRPTSAG